MMDNNSLKGNVILKLEGFSLTPTITNLIFILFLIIYIFTITANAVMLGVLVFDKKLHEPMYLLLWTMPINDLIGICSIMPRILMDLLSTAKEISYNNCIAQAFFIHIYASVSLTILAAMAYDRYIAICNPLRYHTIMTKRITAVLSLVVWAFSFSLIMTLFGLVLRLPLCRNIINHIACDHTRILSLTCANITVNNIYGLVGTAVVNAIALSSVIYSYVKILITCLSNRHAESKSKAIYTCSTHLLVFAIFEISSLSSVIAYRLEKVSKNFRHIMAMTFVIIPTLANPIIYGMKTKDIRKRITEMFKIRIFPNN
ncbi:putative gustatory receptor clone PTE03 [Latimeria chalumnae]|nr:PREDICTED: putative gustatory receptor clone PTE03 [Latimeria chalumnae]|eukprot:XP_006009365.2 PREDICTED: putative gustatory receptor clone PTE03 [Latimeria chalumnae]